jgi:hypothetical protein
MEHHNLSGAAVTNGHAGMNEQCDGSVRLGKRGSWMGELGYAGLVGLANARSACVSRASGRARVPHPLLHASGSHSGRVVCRSRPPIRLGAAARQHSAGPSAPHPPRRPRPPRGRLYPLGQLLGVQRVRLPPALLAKAPVPRPLLVPAGPPLAASRRAHPQGHCPPGGHLHRALLRPPLVPGSLLPRRHAPCREVCRHAHVKLAAHRLVPGRHSERGRGPAAPLGALSARHRARLAGARLRGHDLLDGHPRKARGAG